MIFNFSPTHDDIEIFENYNQLCVTIWEISGKYSIVFRQGNNKLVLGATINLLLISNEDKTKPHYKFIKK